MAEGVELSKFAKEYLFRPGDYLQRQVEESFSKISNSEAWKIFCSSNPFATVITAQWCYIIVYLSSLLFMGYIFTSPPKVKEYSHAEPSYASFRLSGLQLRNGRELGGAAFATSSLEEEGGFKNLGLGDMGMLVVGREHPPQPVARFLGGSIAELEFNESVSVAGFWLTTSDSTPDEDLVRFRLEGKERAGTWRLLSESARCSRATKAEFDMPLQRNATVIVDWSSLECLWPFWVTETWSFVFQGFTLFVTGYFGQTGRGRQGTFVVVWGYVVVLAMESLATIELHLSGRVWFAPGRWSNQLGIILWPISMAPFEPWCIEFALVCHLWHSFYSATFDERGDRDLSTYLVLVITAVLILIKRKIRYNARMGVKDAQHLFDEAWEAVSRDAGGLTKLEQVIAARYGAQGAEPTGFVRKRRIAAYSPAAVHTPGASVESSKLRFLQNSPILAEFASSLAYDKSLTSTDQCYFQARALEPKFRDKVKHWALSSEGCFKLRPETAAGLVKKWRDCVGTHLEELVQFTPIKSETRAIDKLCRCYSQDPSRLTDVLRESIIFHTLVDLIGCLETILLDTDVEVVRLRNRYLRGCCAKDTAGMRHVKLNFRFKSPEIQQLSLDGHCCELLLVLKPFVECMTEEAHQSYIRLRNTRFVRLYTQVVSKIRGFSQSHQNQPESTNFSASKTVFDAGDSPSADTKTPSNPVRRVDSGRSTSYLLSAVPASDGTADASIQEFDEKGSNAVPEREDLSVAGRHDPVPISESATLVEHGDCEECRSRGLPDGHCPSCHHVLIHDQGGHIKSTIKEVLIQKQVWPANILDQMRKEYHHAFKLSHTESVFYTKTPVTAALSKRAVHCLLMAICVASCYLFGVRYKHQMTTLRTSSTSVRLTVLELRDGTPIQADLPCNIGRLGVSISSRYKIPHLEKPRKVEISGSQIVNDYSHPIQITSIYIDTAANKTEKDPVRFAVHVSSDRHEWTQLAENHCNTFHTEMLHPPPKCFAAHQLADVPLARNARINVTLDLAWYERIPEACMMVPLIFGSLGAAFCGALSRPWLGKVILVLSIQFFAFSLIVSAFGSVVEQDGGLSMVYFLEGMLIFGVSMVLGMEVWFPQVLIVQVIGTFCIEYLFLLVVARDPAGIVKRVQQIPFIILVIFTSVLIVSRTAMLYRSRKRVAEDKEEYEVQWRLVLQSDQANCLHSILEVCAGMGIRHDKPRQTIHKALPGRTAAVFLKHSQLAPENLSSNSGDDRVKSLDQVYCMALCCQPMLQSKVRVWAAGSNGYFRLSCPFKGSVYAKWEDAKQNPELSSKIKWAGLKSVDRAIEKLCRVYKGEVARLVDLCRECLVFENLADLCRCLEMISRDLEVEVLRCKNRFLDDYDVWETCGYRDVNLNLRIVTTDTISLGLDGHVCEVQLVLKNFMDLRTNDGHQRYVRWRNLLSK